MTLNRVSSVSYPSNVCSVVYDKHQFSWTREKLKVADKNAWARAKDIAYKALAEYDELKTFKATHFHHVSINPGWKLKRVAKIGNHVFYK